MDETESIVSLSPFEDKWKGFGWHVTHADGNEISSILSRLQEDRDNDISMPRIIIAHTTKGKGISFMENVPIWHYRMPNEEEMEIVRKDLQL